MISYDDVGDQSTCFTTAPTKLGHLAFRCTSVSGEAGQ